MGKILEDAGFLAMDKSGKLNVTDATVAKYFRVRKKLMDDGNAGLPFPCIEVKKKPPGVIDITVNDRDKYPVFFEKWIDNILLNSLLPLNTEGNIALPVFDPLAMGAALKLDTPKLPLPALLGALAIPPGTPIPLLMLGVPPFEAALKLGEIPGVIKMPEMPSIPMPPIPIPGIPSFEFTTIEFGMMAKLLDMQLKLPKAFIGLFGKVLDISFLASFATNPLSIFTEACKVLKDAAGKPGAADQDAFDVNNAAVNTITAEALGFSVLGSIIGSSDSGIIGNLGAIQGYRIGEKKETPVEKQPIPEYSGPLENDGDGQLQLGENPEKHFIPDYDISAPAIAQTPENQAPATTDPGATPPTGDPSQDAITSSTPGATSETPPAATPPPPLPEVKSTTKDEATLKLQETYPPAPGPPESVKPPEHAFDFSGKSEVDDVFADLESEGRYPQTGGLSLGGGDAGGGGGTVTTTGGPQTELRRVFLEELQAVLGPIPGPGGYPKIYNQKGPGKEVFNIVAPNWYNNPGPPKVTSCPTLPMCIANRALRRMRPDLKLDGSGITGNGLWSAFAIGHILGAWIDADNPSIIPKPGDIYLFTSDFKDPGDYTKFEPDVKHIGIIVNATPGNVNVRGQPVWRTADAGLGLFENQAAGYVERRIMAKGNFWVTDANPPNNPPPEGAQGAAVKRILGWIDLDLLNPHVEKLMTLKYNRFFTAGWYGKYGASMSTLRKRVKNNYENIEQKFRPV